MSNLLPVAEGSQIVIIGQDASELSSLQDMGNHPIVIYNEVCLAGLFKRYKF